MSKKPPAPPKSDQFVPGATYRVREADWSVFWGEGLDHVTAQKLKGSVVGQRKSTTAVIENEKLGPPPELEERAVAARQKLRSTPVPRFRVRDADWSKVWGEHLLEHDAMQLKNKVVGERKSKTATIENMDVAPPSSVTADTVVYFPSAMAATADPQLAQLQASVMAKAGDTAKAAQVRSDIAIARQKAGDDARRRADEAEAESKKILAELAETEGEAVSFMSKMVRDLSPEERAELEASGYIDDDGGIEDLINGGGDVPTDEEVKIARESFNAMCLEIGVGAIVIHYLSENVNSRGGSSMAKVIAVRVPGQVFDLHSGITDDMLEAIPADAAAPLHTEMGSLRLVGEPRGPIVEGVVRRDLSDKTTNTWSPLQ